VTVDEPARIFRISSAALRKIAASDGDQQTIIYLAFEAGMRVNLITADRRLAGQMNIDLRTDVTLLAIKPSKALF
jgi:hypothetical protein